MGRRGGGGGGGAGKGLSHTPVAVIGGDLVSQLPPVSCNMCKTGVSVCEGGGV